MRKTKFSEVVKSYLHSIYGNNLKEKKIDKILKKIFSLFQNQKTSIKNLGSEKDIFLITYADSIKKKMLKI